MKLAIIGSGGHAKVVLDAALECGWQEIVLLDDSPSAPKDLQSFPVIGSTALLGGTLLPQEYAVFVAIGSNGVRARLSAQAEAAGFTLPVLLHPRATVSRFADLSQAQGSVFLPGSIVCAGARIGRGCITNTAASIDHDCQLGDFVHISPGAHLAGNTTVGDLAWIGIGACTRQGSRIGRNSTIGAGAAVIADIPADSTALGVPARVIPKD